MALVQCCADLGGAGACASRAGVGRGAFVTIIAGGASGLAGGQAWMTSGVAGGASGLAEGQAWMTTSVEAGGPVVRRTGVCVFIVLLRLSLSPMPQRYAGQGGTTNETATQ